MSDPAPTSTQDHPSLEVLASYRKGNLPSVQAEGIQDHLVTCPQCCDALLDLADLASPDPPSEPAQWDDAKTEAWEKLRTSVFPEESSGTVVSLESRQASATPRGAGVSRLAAAAMVVLSLMIGGLAASLLLETSGGVAEIAQAREAAEQARQELDEKNRAFEGVQERVADLEKDLEKLSSPWLNVEEFNLFPRGFVRGGPEGVEVTVPEDPTLYTLTLNLLDTGQHSQYRLRVSAMDGSEIWAVGGLKKSRLGSISIALPHDFFAPGRYGLKLEGETGEVWHLAAEYDLEVH